MQLFHQPNVPVNQNLLHEAKNKTERLFGRIGYKK
jgi:hypothetical protein